MTDGSAAQGADPAPAEVAEPDFDVIVVGAGIAGLVTAYRLAQRGRSVVVIERGEAPGSKNLSGGVLYSRVLEEVFPDLLQAAPVERRITRNYIQFLNGSSSVGIDYHDARLAEPTNAVTVLRARLDAWIAERCEEVGVFLMPGVRVDEVLQEGGRVVGVRAGQDELRAHVVVAADGVNSFLARAAGLRAAPPTRHLGLGVKAVVGLPAATIEERFHLAADEGVAYAIVGDCTQGEDAGYHVAALALRVVRAMAAHVDVVSMNEDELQGYLARRVDLLDAAEVTRAATEVRGLVGARTLIVHTRWWSLAVGPDAQAYRAALRGGIAMASARYAYGDTIGPERYREAGTWPSDPRSLRVVALLEEAGVVCEPGVVPPTRTPTTIGLGDAFVGGVVKVLAEEQG